MKQELRTELWHIPGNENLESALQAFYEGYRPYHNFRLLSDEERILILENVLSLTAVFAYRDKADQYINMDEDEKGQFVRMLCEEELLVQFGYIFDPPVIPENKSDI